MTDSRQYHEKEIALHAHVDLPVMFCLFIALSSSARVPLRDGAYPTKAINPILSYIDRLAETSATSASMAASRASTQPRGMPRAMKIMRLWRSSDGQPGSQVGG